MGADCQRTLLSLNRALLIVLLIGGLSGCGGSASPTAPPPPPPPAQVQLAVFRDSVSGFSTSDVRDSQDQIVRFDITGSALIWVIDGRRFSGFPVTGNLVRADGFFQVRFGTKDGERRAYFTETVATTICDIEIVGGSVSITSTSQTVPGN
ncbi:MAG: hypothetical protein H0W08_10025 [Acidobacteria bacterium]|nr:hypothetical protein [Acidobacteriota bacterium]